MTLLETACLDFCIELLNQKTKVHKYKSLLVYAMAVLGCGKQGWRDADSYPPILSCVLKVARFLVVQKIWAAAAKQGLWVGKAADQELAWLFEDKGDSWSMASMALLKCCLTGARWSFLQDACMLWPVAGKTWLVDQISTELAVARAFITQGTVSANKVQKYFQQVAQFKEKLAVAVHLTSRAPARVPELLSIQHINTNNNWRRNIFIEDSLVVFVTAYHKGFYASNNVKIIH
ncbi:predicted protein [Aspergillus nidulans FGSC A4]|uniref:Uncharacterized protein n=1 Tax=Emericella nidulans (strain FGSC A4 / ATCC 38163 / CBS 112.46 / NRRL 194 / M139) TaxID=227321 RepID=Q5AXK9_EMENI|nr:hypothetical protein [Aspergillus nidulans FGSC A4]EAA57613.1 predicted protein [Aspergillus nidulans FGSC A4]CBF71862.1 TPA: conserved hypothetical protein [Aspergillus nidulans FGSC A4]|eukprot:XP_664575.1 predicted protein [Aspergillus nidulans FGSC A4]